MHRTCRSHSDHPSLFGAPSVLRERQLRSTATHRRIHHDTPTRFRDDSARVCIRRQDRPRTLSWCLHAPACLQTFSPWSRYCQTNKDILKSWLEPAIAVPRSALPFPQTYYQQGPTSTSLSHLLLLQFKPRDSVHYWIQVLCLPLLDVSNSGAECQRTHEASCQPLSISESRLHRCSSISPSQFLIKFLCLLWLPHKSLVTYATDCTDRVERAGVARLRQGTKTIRALRGTTTQWFYLRFTIQFSRHAKYRNWYFRSHVALPVPILDQS
jgi:hypothetical protein